jgi:hypothetical protein
MDRKADDQDISSTITAFAATASADISAIATTATKAVHEAYGLVE